MGKDKKSKVKHPYRHDPLDKQILENSFAQPSSRSKIRRKPLEDDKFVGNKLTNEILKQARQQQEDLEEEIGFSCSSSAPLPCLDTSDKSENEEEFSDTNSVKETDIEETKISEEDKQAIEKFMVEDSQKEILAEAIKETLTEKKTEIYTHFSDLGSVLNDSLDEKKLLVFKKLAPILKEYRSGKFPKIFKTIPSYTNWEQLLDLTEPDTWSDAVMYVATRVFSSNLPDPMAQRFYNKFLLPRLRDEIKESKKLSTHLYQALKKALYKPAAFFKGIVIPLCKSGDSDSTHREASIISSVLAKYSIPVLHSSAALLTIAEMEYSGVGSIFMRTLLEKKYALPYRAVNAVVSYFLRFMNDTKEYPVLWHQCLLTFVQIYKVDLSPEQKTNLLKLLTVHSHKDITPEIRRELVEKPDLNEVMQQMWKI